MRDRQPRVDRAVSDVVGFVLVVSLVLLAVGIVSVGGMSALQDARQAEQANNAERAFEVFAANVEDVVRGGAPGRQTEIQLGDARIGYGDPVQFNVSFPETGESFSATVRPVVYDTGEGTRIVYVNGAVIRDQSDAGAVLLRQPGFTLKNRAVVPYVVTRATGQTSVAGSGRVLLRADAASRTVYAYTNPPGEQYNVTLNVTSDRAAVWERHLDGKDDVECTQSGATVSCDFRSEKVYVQAVQVDLEIK